MNFMNNIRTLVSKDKFRFTDNELGIELDLTYITPRVIAMGLPTEGLGKVWRNDINEVGLFFRHHHRGHFLVLNVSERSYDQSKLDCRVIHLPWPDHHAPPLRVLLECVQRMDSFLQADPANVVAVHCKAGRGRTGTVISCYLMYSRNQPTAQQAMKYFAENRSRTSEGVAVPSQVRYVEYYEKILQSGSVPEPKTVRIDSISICDFPSTSNGFFPSVEIVRYDQQRSACVVFPGRFTRQTAAYRGQPAIVPAGHLVAGDVLIRIYNDDPTPPALRTLVTRLQFYTGFLCFEGKSGTLIVRKNMLDAAKSGTLMNDSSIPASFTVTVSYSHPTEPPPVISDTQGKHRIAAPHSYSVPSDLGRHNSYSDNVNGSQHMQYSMSNQATDQRPHQTIEPAMQHTATSQATNNTDRPNYPLYHRGSAVSSLPLQANSSTSSSAQSRQAEVHLQNVAISNDGPLSTDELERRIQQL